MEVYKIDLPKEENISSRKNFIANDIFVCAIKPTATPDNFLLLFKAVQKLDNSVVYFQIMIKAQSIFCVNFLANHELYIDNTITKKSQKYELYKSIIKDMTIDNIFATDLNMKKDSSGKYFTCTGIRSVNNKNASIIDIYFPKYNFIKMKLFLNSFLNMKLGMEIVFVTNIYNDIKFVELEDVKYDGSTIITNKLQSTPILFNHYTFCIGDKTRFRANYISKTSEEKKLLSKEIEYYAFLSLYEKDYLISDIITDGDGNMYILYETYSLDGKIKDMYALTLDKELYNKTNFLDTENVVYL